MMYYMENPVTIVVTRNGMGDWLLFDTFEDADSHPLVQYGDVIMSRHEDILTQWTRLELPSLMEILELEGMPIDRETILRNSAKIWARMAARAARPPEDPAEICAMVRRDRELSKKERVRMNATADTAPKADKKKASEKPQTRKFPAR
jgi:hypothetical protein